MVLVAPAALATPFDQTLPDVGLERGHLLGCPSNFNCVSSASKSAAQFASPWTSEAGLTAEAAADALVTAFTTEEPRTKLLKSEQLPEGLYLRLQVPGRFSLPDEVEFLIRPPVTGRNFSDGEGLLITLRSIAGTVLYVYPFFQPVSDGGLQKSRLAAVRGRLGWRLVGCELQECYDTS